MDLNQLYRVRYERPERRSLIHKENDMGHIDSNLHPVFQQALAPLVQTPKSRAARKSTQTFWFCLAGVDLECELDYEASSGDGWNEPREPEAAYLGEGF